MRRLLVAICLIITAAAPRCYGSTKGEELLEKCQKAIHLVDNGGGLVKDQFDEGWCMGWVESAVSLSALHEQWKSRNQQSPGLLGVCVAGKGITLIQSARVVVKYLTDHPESLQEDGMELTIAALKGSFPCNP